MGSNGARELMRRCAVRRDASVWQEFRSRFEVRLVAGLRRGLRRTGLHHPPVEVEDLLQDVYCKLLEARLRPLDLPFEEEPGVRYRDEARLRQGASHMLE